MTWMEFIVAILSLLMPLVMLWAANRFTKREVRAAKAEVKDEVNEERDVARVYRDESIEKPTPTEAVAVRAIVKAKKKG